MVFCNTFVKPGIDKSNLSDTENRNNAINLGEIAPKMVVTKENEK